MVFFSRSWLEFSSRPLIIPNSLRTFSIFHSSSGMPSSPLLFLSGQVCGSELSPAAPRYLYNQEGTDGVEEGKRGEVVVGGGARVGRGAVRVTRFGGEGGRCVCVCVRGSVPEKRKKEKAVGCWLCCQQEQPGLQGPELFTRLTVLCRV